MALNAKKRTADNAARCKHDGGGHHDDGIIFGTLHAPKSCESVAISFLAGSEAYSPPPFPSHGRAGKTARQTASAARSPDCAVALVVLAHAYLHAESRGRIHQNDDIDISKHLINMRWIKKRGAEI